MKQLLKSGKLDIAASNACGIYGIQFPDNRWLVGCSVSILVRIARYISGEKINTKTKDAISKHGWKSVKIYLLEECIPQKDVLLKKESEWSIKLKSYTDGYNMVPCGQTNINNGICAARPKYDAAFKQKVSDAMVEHHAKNRCSTGKYKNWKKLYIAAKTISPSMQLGENLGTHPSTEFEMEFSKLSKWNKKRVLSIIKS